MGASTDAATDRTRGEAAEDRPDATADPWLTVYRLQGCPFCERVVRVLQDLDLPYRSRFVEPHHSKRNVVKRTAGVRAVPVLVDDRTGVTMAESANVVEYLHATYGTDAAEPSGTAATSTDSDDSPTDEAAGGDD